MKKFLLMVVLAGTIGIGNSSAQGMPVIDLPHILETIYNGYQIYQQVQNTLQQLRYAYESTKAQFQQLQQFDFSSIDSFTDAVSLVDRQLSFLRQTENRLKNMRIKIGNGSYDLLSLYEIPRAVTLEMMDDLTREMSEEEKAKAWSHYGLSPANYLYVQTWNKRLSDVSQQLQGMRSTEEEIESDLRRVDELSKGAKSAEGSLEVGQIQAEIEKETYLVTQKIAMVIQAIGEVLAVESEKNKFIPERIHASSDFLEGQDE